MSESYLEKERALELLIQLARAVYPEGTEFPEGEKTNAEARAVMEEMIEWCGMKKIPAGALYTAADELNRRLGKGAQDLKSIHAGNLSVEYRESDTTRWHMQLRPWRRVRF